MSQGLSYYLWALSPPHRPQLCGLVALRKGDLWVRVASDGRGRATVGVGTAGSELLLGLLEATPNKSSPSAPTAAPRILFVAFNSQRER